MNLKSDEMGHLVFMEQSDTELLLLRSAHRTVAGLRMEAMAKYLVLLRGIEPRA